MNNIFVKRLYSKKSLERLHNKIIKLGSNSKIDVYKYLNNKLIVLIIIFILLIVFSSIGYILAPIITFILYFLYDYIFLDVKIRKRAKSLEHDAIFFFEILSLTMSTDNNLKLCLEITSDSIDSELSMEFREMLKEIRLGKSMREALENLRKRIPSVSVNNVILNLIEAAVYGNNINQALNNQIEYITDKRVLEIKGDINKLPTKISIVSVIFFIPLILALIISPLLINYFIK